MHSDADSDDQLTVLRRLFAVAVARARESVTVGYKIGEESDLLGYLSEDTFKLIDL